MSEAVAQARAGRVGGRVGRRRGESGQVLVEAAIVMPAMTFLILCAIQVTMLQHARIMTEYAAYTAARTGAVFNADPDAMRDSAEIALTPTMGRTDDFTNFMATYARKEVYKQVQRAILGVRPVSVRILNPKPDDFSGNLGRHLNGTELDFDDVRTQASRATLLSIEVRYLYEMRIPFANRMILAIFLAQQTGWLNQWRGMDMTAPKAFSNNGPDAVTLALLRSPSTAKLAGNALVRAGITRSYYFPLFATYTMRMQSNPYLNKVQLGQNFN